MKHLKSSIMFMAAAAMTFTSCSDSEEFNVDAGNGRVLTVTAQNPVVQEDTRTGISVDAGSVVKPIWTAGDRLVMYGDDNLTTAISPKLTESAEKASFIFDDPYIYPSTKELLFSNISTVMQKDEEGRFYFEFSPLSREDSNKPNKLKPNFMHPINDILVSDRIDLGMINFNQPLEIKLKRISSVLRINLLNGTGMSDADEYLINSVEIGPTDDENLSLLRVIRYYPDTDEIIPCEGKYSIKFERRRGDGCKDYYLGSKDGALYAACSPGTIKKGTKIKVWIGFSYQEVKMRLDMTLTMKEDVKFEPGKITTFNINYIPDVLKK